MQNMRKELIVIVFAIAFIMAKRGNAQTIIGDPINYYSERVSADSLDKIFSKRIPVEFDAKNCTLEDLTKHHWLSVYFSNIPFTTELAVYAHEKAFEYYGGKPKKILYDQDAVLLLCDRFGKRKVVINSKRTTNITARTEAPDKTPVSSYNQYFS